MVQLGPPSSDGGSCFDRPKPYSTKVRPPPHRNDDKHLLSGLAAAARRTTSSDVSTGPIFSPKKPESPTHRGSAVAGPRSWSPLAPQLPTTKSSLALKEAAMHSAPSTASHDPPAAAVRKSAKSQLFPSKPANQGFPSAADSNSAKAELPPLQSVASPKVASPAVRTAIVTTSSKNVSPPKVPTAHSCMPVVQDLVLVVLAATMLVPHTQQAKATVWTLDEVLCKF